MSSTTAWLITIAVLALIVGGISGVALFPQEVTKTVNAPTPDPVVQYVNQTVTEEVSVPINVEDTYLTPALSEIFDEFDRDDDFLTCDGDNYDRDEVSISRINDWSYTWLDDDKYEVTAQVKYKFEDNSDNRACKEVRDVIAFYEDGEEPDYDWNLA